MNGRVITLKFLSTMHKENGKIFHPVFHDQKGRPRTPPPPPLYKTPHQTTTTTHEPRPFKSNTATSASYNRVIAVLPSWGQNGNYCCNQTKEFQNRTTQQSETASTKHKTKQGKQGKAPVQGIAARSGRAHNPSSRSAPQSFRTAG